MTTYYTAASSLSELMDIIYQDTKFGVLDSQTNVNALAMKHALLIAQFAKDFPEQEQQLNNALKHRLWEAKPEQEGLQ